MEHFIIHCRKRYVQAFLYEFGYQFAEMKESARILWHGASRKRLSGMLVIEWSGQVSSSFLNKLDRDEDILDYVRYELPCSNKDQILTNIQWKRPLLGL